ncbi:MAG TPA: endonuclease domain-containing protein [Caulobacterales bacterium]|nr:endonuclease domain-containing protein [Caulobacterales bacterium]
MRLAERNARPLARALRKQMTNAETILWSRLRRCQINGLKFRRQHPVMAYVADFACSEARLIVEVDGPSHARASERAHDSRRDELLRKAGWRVLRITNDDVYRNLGAMLDLISRSARCAPSVPDCVRDASPASGGGKYDPES